MNYYKTLLIGTALSLAAQSWAGGLIRLIEDNTKTRTLIANAFGQSLYVFDPDLKSAQPACVGTCAEKWPPLIATAEELTTLQATLPADEANLYNLISRESALMQVTYRGRPLYVFYLDREELSKKGDGLGGVWHLAVETE